MRISLRASWSLWVRFLRLWGPYVLAVLLAIASAYSQAQSTECLPTGGVVLTGPGAGSLQHNIDWAGDACASEAAILLAESGFVWSSCSVSGTVMTGNVTDQYGSLIFAGRQWQRLPVGCTASTGGTGGTGGSSGSVVLDVSAIPLLSMTPEDAQTVGYAIWVLWAAAWSLSVLRRAIPVFRDDDE